MKKLLLLGLFLIFSCSKDDIDNGCYCDIKVTADGISYYYVNNVELDCETGSIIRPDNVDDNHFMSCRE